MNRKNIEDLYPLSPLQQGMLFHTLYAPESGAYAEHIAMTLRGDVNADALAEAWRRVVQRHPVLRTGFVWEGVPQPLQVVFREVTLPFRAEDWSSLPREEALERFRAAVEEDRRAGWELARAPLLRLLLAKVAPDEHRLLISYHHLLLDGWSHPIVFGEVHALYAGLLAGRVPEIPKRRPFHDYIAWLGKQDEGAAEAFWRQRLAGFAEPTPLPLDRDPSRSGKPNETHGQETMIIPPSVREALTETARRHRVTLNTLIQGAWGLLLARHGGVDEAVYGGIVSGRPPEIAGIDEMVGMFINTIPVRMVFPADKAVGDWLRELQQREAEARQFEHAPLMRVRGWSEVATDRPLFETAFAFENFPISGARLSADDGNGEDEREEEARPAPASTFAITEGKSSERTSFPLSVACAPVRAGIRVTATWDGARLDAERAHRLLEGYRTLLEQLAADQAKTVGELTPMTAEERRVVVEEWNRTTTDFPRATPIHRLFEEQARQTPDALALSWDGEQITYAELNARANRLARELQALGVERDTRVGVSLDRSPELVVAMLAILKAGGAYVPLDPSYPAERRAFMRRDSGVSVLVVGNGSEEDAEGTDEVATLSLSHDQDAIEARPAGDLTDVEIDAEALAYVMYTSGSTGTPKGIGIPHRGIARLVRNTDFVQLTPADRVAQVSNASFDAATFEIWGPLLNGGAVVGIDREISLSPASFAAALREEGVTTLFLTTALFNQMAREVPDGFRTLSHVLFGGEAVDPAAVRRVLQAGPPARLLHVYGPTESTTYSTWHLVESVEDGAATVPIGRPLANTTAYVLDPSHRPVPIGAPGELYIGGDGLAAGYLGRPDLTGERFVASPFVSGQRLYRTGDRVRWNLRGEIEFLGRLDRQVKIRGFRIEPDEVEAALLALPQVREGVVMVREDTPGWKRLVAYAVPREGGATTPAGLREALGRTLPDYMMPSAFVLLPELPLNPNGKVDRAALPAPEAGVAADEYVAPRTPTEETLAGIWAEVLRTAKIGAHDSFFELGGHSLMATQLVTRVRASFNVDLPLRAVFEAPRLSELAERIDGMRRGGSATDVPILPMRRGGDLPVSFAQERLWFLHELDPRSPAYNIPATQRLEGALDVDALRAALSEVVRRHEPLRTVFAVVEGRPVQRVQPAAEVALPVTDLSHLGAEAREAEARRLAAEDAQAPFDLAAGPLFRASLLKLSESEHLLVLNFHHVIADGWSMGIFTRELETLFGAFSRGERSPLPELPVQYAEFAAWQRRWLTEERLGAQVAFWKEQLAGAPPFLELPTDFPRPPVQRHRGANVSVYLPRALLDAVHTLASGHNASPAMVLLAAFQLLMGRLSGQDDVVVGAPIAGRTRPETERMIGLFLNTLALRTKLSGEPTFAELLGRVRETMLGAYANQDVPFERLIEELQPQRSLSHTPVFQVLFNMLNLEGAELAATTGGAKAAGSASAGSASVGSTSTSGSASTGSASIGGSASSSSDGAGRQVRMAAMGGGSEIGSKVDLTLYLQESPDALSLNAVYDPDLFTGERVLEMLRQFGRVLHQAVRFPDAPISRFSLVTAQAQDVLPSPQAQVDVGWRGSVGDIVARRTVDNPQATAAEDPRERWTYAELDAAANRIANRLIDGGVNPGDVVAVFAHRSAALARALLGTLKSGAAFLVLDPAYPAARLAEYVRIAQPRGFLRIAAAGEVPAEVASALESTTVVTIDLGPKAEAADKTDNLESVSDEAPRVEIGVDSLAYLSFTSGTTGAPRAVMGRHGSLTYFTPWVAQEFGLRTTDRFSMLSGLAHDPLHRDVLTPLQLGLATVAPDADSIGTPGYLARWMREAGITVAHLTPAMGQVLTDAPGAEPVEALRLAFFVGDVLTRADVDRLHRLAPNVTVVNYYGSTETQRAVSYHVVPREAEPGEKGIIPLGKGIPDVQLLLRTSTGDLCGVGEPGEIFLRSPHVALGYLGDDTLTADRFIVNPWTGNPRDVMYRTGDLGRYRPDGVVEPLGRADQQVKVRGFRVELGEVESALAAHPSVREAAVVARGTVADRRLVAYVVPSDGSFDAEALRTHLRGMLPDFMVPSAFVALDALPLTANRKLDRAALPEPEAPAARAEAVAPRTPIEEVVASIVAEVLGLENIGVFDDFFANGGHSLRATQVLSRIQQTMDVTLPLRTIFEQPTVAGIAAAVEASGGGEIARMLDELEGLSDEEIEALLAAEEA